MASPAPGPSMPLSLSLLLLTGCHPRDRLLEDVMVESARLENVSLSEGAVLVGVVGGSADLVVTQPDGTTFTAPIRMRGVSIGLAVAVTSVLGTKADLDLSRLDLPVAADELLGRYKGQSFTAASVLGLRTDHLENRAGVEINKDWFVAGIGFALSFESIRLHVDERDGGEDDGAAQDTDGADTAAADDTAAVGAWAGDTGE